MEETSSVYQIVSVVTFILGWILSAKLYYSIFDVVYFGKEGCLTHFVLFSIGAAIFSLISTTIIGFLLKALGWIILAIAIIAGLVLLVFGGILLYNRFHKSKGENNAEKCQFCGADMNLDDDFCTACGKKREIAVTEDTLPTEEDTKQPYICKNCGAEIPDGDMFCMKCGTKKEL